MTHQLLLNLPENIYQILLKKAQQKVEILIVWQTITKNLPVLLTQIKKVIEQES